jgi:hypothetical protein
MSASVNVNEKEYDPSRAINQEPLEDVVMREGSASEWTETRNDRVVAMLRKAGAYVDVSGAWLRQENCYITSFQQWMQTEPDVKTIEYVKRQMETCGGQTVRIEYLQYKFDRAVKGEIFAIIMIAFNPDAPKPVEIMQTHIAKRGALLKKLQLFYAERIVSWIFFGPMETSMFSESLDYSSFPMEHQTITETEWLVSMEERVRSYYQKFADEDPNEVAEDASIYFVCQNKEVLPREEIRSNWRPARMALALTILGLRNAEIPPWRIDRRNRGRIKRCFLQCSGGHTNVSAFSLYLALGFRYFTILPFTLWTKFPIGWDRSKFEQEFKKYATGTPVMMLDLARTSLYSRKDMVKQFTNEREHWMIFYLALARELTTLQLGTDQFLEQIGKKNRSFANSSPVNNVFSTFQDIYAKKDIGSDVFLRFLRECLFTPFFISFPPNAAEFSYTELDTALRVVPQLHTYIKQQRVRVQEVESENEQLKLDLETRRGISVQPVDPGKRPRPLDEDSRTTAATAFSETEQYKSRVEMVGSEREIVVLSDICCQVCEQKNATMFACGACEKTIYCSSICQGVDWPRHVAKCSMKL